MSRVLNYPYGYETKGVTLMDEQEREAAITLYANCRQVAIAEHLETLAEYRKYRSRCNHLRMTIKGLSSYLNLPIPQECIGRLDEDIYPPMKPYGKITPIKEQA